MWKREFGQNRPRSEYRSHVIWRRCLTQVLLWEVQIPVIVGFSGPAGRLVFDAGLKADKRVRGQSYVPYVFQESKAAPLYTSTDKELWNTLWFSSAKTARNLSPKIPILPWEMRQYKVFANDMP